VKQLLDLYPVITKGCSINKIGQPFSYYYADETKSNILVTSCIEYDIKSAFPNISKFILGEDHQFVKEIFKIDDKLKRNIFISTTLTEENKKGNNFLTINELNIYCKIIILGYIYSTYKNINILEYKKDGILISGVEKQYNTKEERQFLEIVKSNFTLHKESVTIYSRLNKTSILKYKNNKISIKGKYKKLPTYINDKIIPKFFNGDIYNKNLLSNIYSIYGSEDLFYLCYNYNILDKIDYYFKFQDGGFLDYNADVQSDIKQISIINYLTYLIYPLLSLMRVNKDSFGD
jgi:hypothetical protein